MTPGSWHSRKVQHEFASVFRWKWIEAFQTWVLEQHVSGVSVDIPSSQFWKQTHQIATQREENHVFLYPTSSYIASTMCWALAGLTQTDRQLFTGAHSGTAQIAVISGSWWTHFDHSLLSFFLLLSTTFIKNMPMPFDHICCKDLTL